MIPRHLDDPPMVFMWDADEAGIFIFTDAVRCPVSAIHRGNRPGVSRGTGTGPDQTGRGGRGLILRFLYWYTRSDTWIKCRAPSFVREYAG